MVEIWKDIPDYEELYQVSNLGRAKSLPKKIWNGKVIYNSKEKILKAGKDSGNYFLIVLRKNNKNKSIRIHRLVMLAFKGKSNLTVNHIDGDKSNNRLDNLEYCTQSENNRHARRNGLNNSKKDIKVKQYDRDNNFIKEYESISGAARQTRISYSSIYYCLINKLKTAGGFIWRKV